MARYVKTAWLHEWDYEPVEIFSEIGPDGYETRTVHRFRDGTCEWADGQHETVRVGLALMSLDQLGDSGDQALAMSAIDSEEFEQEWRRARAET